MDVGSDVELMDVGFKAPGESTFTWSNAPRCVDALYQGNTWCPYFTSDGEGTYTIQFRAVDSVGNEAYSDEYTIYVDESAPVADSDYNNTWRQLTPSDDVKLQWTLDLTGTVTDPDLSNGIDGSGIYSQTLGVELRYEGGKPLPDGVQGVVLTGDTWTADYELNGAELVGTYEVWFTAEDKVGNSISEQVGTIRLDAREPQVDSSTWEIPEIISDATVIRGTVSEQPSWASTVAQFHFEEAITGFAPTDSATLYDGSYYNQHASCTGSGCPGSVTGQFGQALAFDGNDDQITVTDVLTDESPLDLDTLSMSFWLYPTANAGGSGSTLLMKGDAAGDSANYALQLASGSTRLRFTADDATCTAAIGALESVSSLSLNTWTHIAASYDGTTARLYINGAEAASAEWSGELCQSNEPMRLGNGGGAGAFAGRMDEVRLFARALSTLELSALAEAEYSGVAEVDIALERIDLESEEVVVDNLTYTDTTVTAPSSELSEWNYTIPDDMPEDFYTVYIRGRDQYNNEGEAHGVWRGPIDMHAPRITFDASTWGVGANQYTDYRFTIEDLILDTETIESICDASVLEFTYHTGYSLVKEATGMCRVQGAPDLDATVTACDAVPHCTTVEVDTPTTPANMSAIITPSVGEAYEGLDPIDITGFVLSNDGLESLELTLDGQTIYTETWGVGETEATWETTWTPTAPGTYELEATLTTNSNGLVSDPFINKFTVHAPDLTLTKSVTPTTELQMGDAVTYTLTLSNSGDRTATNVEVTDELPAGIDGVAFSESLTITPGTVLSFTIPATVTNQLTTTLTNTAQFTHTWQGDSAEAVVEVCDVAMVTNANDSGVGSLRQALNGACGPAIIYFTDDLTIRLNSTLTLNKDITLDSNGHNVTLSGDSDNDGDGDVRVLSVADDVTVTLSGLTITHGYSNDGAGIYNLGTLTVVDSVIANNSTHDWGSGSGIFNQYGTLTLTRVTFTNNVASSRGGALFSRGPTTITDSVFEENSVRPHFGDQAGGAIFNEAALTIDGTRFAENSASVRGGTIYNAAPNELTITNSLILSSTAGVGGGIYSEGELLIENSTFVGNSATSTTYGGGGGIYATSPGTVTVRHSTFSENSSGYEGAAIYSYRDSTLILENSVLAYSNGNSECYDFVDTTPVSTSATLVEDGSCSATMSGDPLLGTLGDYGGIQETLPLLPGSPVINAGDDALCTDSDQRGMERVGLCDMGAFESQGFTVTESGGNAQSTPIDMLFNDPLSATVAAVVATEPVAGGVVTFTAPDTGASLVQSVYTGTINATGVVSAVVTANNEAGSYTVVASTNGSEESADFTLTNSCFGSSVVVANDNDTGAGSLRRAINNICDNGIITFAADSTIYLSSTLEIEKSLTINANGFTVTISGDSSNDGSANVRLLDVVEGHTLTLSGVTLADGNATTGAGGAIRSEGTLSLESVTIRDSSAATGGAAIYTSGAATLLNSTISGSDGSSAIWSDVPLSSMALSLSGSTIADSSGNGVVAAGTLNLNNTIIAGSTGDDCVGNGTVNIDDHTLIEDGSCDAPLSGDPLLAPLGDYGGTTFTHALLPGSPAIDAEDACESTDQRGQPRYGTCDVGAFESQGFTLAYLSGTDQRTSINTNFPNNLRVQVTANAANEPVGTGGGVEFVAPDTGASLSALLLVANTDNTGIATLTATANEITGTFTVSATVVGAAEVIPFTLTNYNCAAPLVTNDSDSAIGSLRQAIVESCTGATITFTDSQTIYLDSPLTVNKTLTIDASDQEVVISGDSNNDGTRNVQPFRIEASGAVTLTNLSIIDGTSSNSGGGAIYNMGALSVYDSLFQNNHSTTGAGGGAIYSTNQLTIVGSTFYTNTADIGGAVSITGQGLIANSTFADNTVTDRGGGVYTHATITLINNTFVENTGVLAGGIYNRGGNGVMTIHNNLFARNVGVFECFNAGSYSGGNNLASNTNNCNVPTSSTIYMSGQGNYGGETPTYALELGSSAIDAGNSTYCNANPVNGVDQRGEARAASCDIGAFEARFTLELTAGDDQSTIINTNFPNPLELTIDAPYDAPVGTNGAISFSGPSEGAGISAPQNDNPDENGLASVTVSANDVTGSYVVTGTTPGAVAPVLFNLTNTGGGLVVTDATFEVDEDAGNGTELGTVPTVNETGTTITYSIVSGNPNGLFALDSAEGRLTIADNSTLDYESNTTYTLEVAAGNGVLTDTATIGVNVNNLYADLTLNKSATPETVQSGEQLTYTLTFHNHGREIAGGIVITDLMPANVTVLDVTTAGDNGVTITADGTEPYRWTVSNLPPNSGGTITILTEIEAEAPIGDIVNQALIGTTDEESDTNNNESSVTTPMCLTAAEVTSNTSSGSGSLRQAIASSCDGATILFSEVMTITLEESLLVQKNLTIDANGHTVVLSGDAGVMGDPSDNVGVLEMYEVDTVTLRGLTIRDGYSPDGAGGIRIGGGTVTVEESLITENPSGGIMNYGTLTLRNSTVSDNEAMEGAAVVNGYGATAHIENSTLSGNRAIDSGGAIVNWEGTLTILNSTVISNTANTDGNEYGFGGGVYYGGDISSVTVSNSIVAGNLQVDTVDNQVVNDNNCHRETEWVSTPMMVDGGYNLVGDEGSCATDSGTTLTTDATDLHTLVLEPLGMYGGTTPTHALRNGSPAIDAIPTSACTLESDQRGQLRASGIAQGGTDCDIGAYESFSTEELAGDVSCDTAMNTVDGLFILQYDVALRTSTYTCPLLTETVHVPSCDINSDSTCNAVDGLFLLQCDAGLSNSFCPAVMGGQTESARGTEELLVSTVTVGGGTLAETESQITIPITIDTTDSVGAVNVRVTYDPAVVSVAGCAANPDDAFDFGFCNRTVQGRVTMNATSLTGVTGNGLRLATITFTRSATLTEDTTMPLPITINTFTTPSGTAIQATGVAGQLVVEAVPLAVTLASFDATAEPEQVLVAWETASETDVLGFNLLRATTSDISEAVQMNEEIILSQSPGGGQGAMYTWDDEEVTDGETYWYWLVAVDISGAESLFGPVSATYGSPTAIELVSWQVTPVYQEPWLMGALLMLLVGGVVVKTTARRY